jgi:hypothetical protein
LEGILVWHRRMEGDARHQYLREATLRAARRL